LLGLKTGSLGWKPGKLTIYTARHIFI
jgi:hypothetical protein